MTDIRSHRLKAALLCAALATGCSDSILPVAPPEVRAQSALNFLTVLPTAPSLVGATGSAWAVKGKGAGIDIWYHARPGTKDSTKFLEFRLNGASLDRRPDGSVIAAGDSVLITVTVTDPQHLIVQFQPSGLTFTTSQPARLKMFFGECGNDLNGDGLENAGDDSIQNQLSLWKQESATLPWVKVFSTTIHNNREVDGDLAGFTGYAIAY